MAVFLRGRWREKPRQWGPFSAVQAALNKNAERIGIAYENIVLAVPVFAPGDNIDYGSLNLDSINNRAIFQKNAFVFDNTANSVIDFNDKISSFTNGFTCLFEAKLNSLSTDSRIVGKFSSTVDSLRQFFIWMDSGGSGDGWAIALNGPVVSLNYFENDNDAVSNAYQRVCFTYDYSTIAKYINGRLSNSTQRTASLYDPSTPLKIGQIGDSASYFNGSLRYILLLDISLSDEQVLMLQDDPYQLWQPITRRFYSVPTAESLLSSLPTAWKIRVVKNSEASWQTLTGLKYPSSWQIFRKSEISSSHHILTDITQDIASKIFAEKQQTFLSKILNDVSADSSWSVLHRSDADSSWNIFTRQPADVAWKILTGGISEAVTSWKISKQNEIDSAYKILSQSDAITAWTFQTVKSAELAWRILTGGLVETDISWKIINIKDEDLSWRVLEAVSSDSEWKILNVEEDETAWEILSDSVPIPEAVFKLIQQKRTFGFNQQKRTVLF